MACGVTDQVVQWDSRWALTLRRRCRNTRESWWSYSCSSTASYRPSPPAASQIDPSLVTLLSACLQCSQSHHSILTEEHHIVRQHQHASSLQARHLVRLAWCRNERRISLLLLLLRFWQAPLGMHSAKYMKLTRHQSQSGRFWATMIASFTERWLDFSQF